MQLVSESSVMSLQNFDFLASSFATMQFQGREINMQDITGNMDDNSKSWLLNRYDFYLNQLKHPALVL